jgi:hypothetical protein
VSKVGGEMRTDLSGSRFDAGALRPTALAFLKTILACGTLPVDGFQTKVRCAGLLSERRRVKSRLAGWMPWTCQRRPTRRS